MTGNEGTLADLHVYSPFHPKCPPSPLPQPGWGEVLGEEAREERGALKCREEGVEGGRGRAQMEVSQGVRRCAGLQWERMPSSGNQCQGCPVTWQKGGRVTLGDCRILVEGQAVTWAVITGRGRRPGSPARRGYIGGPQGEGGKNELLVLWGPCESVNPHGGGSTCPPEEGGAD